jgi:hypothetical protein
MVISQKLVAAVFTNILTVVVAYVITKFGIHESVAVASQIATVIGIFAGAAAGYVVKELPAFTQQSEVRLEALEKTAGQHSAVITELSNEVGALKAAKDEPEVVPVAPVRPAPRRPSKS